MSTIFLSFLWKWKKVKVKSLSCVQLFMTPWTHQAPLSMGFSRQEYWSGLPFPSPIISLVLHNSSVTIISHFLGPSLMMPWNFINPPQKTWITVLSRFSRVWLCVTLRTVACQAPSVHGTLKAHWLPFPSPGDLPNPRIEPVSLTSPARAGEFFTTSATSEALNHYCS